MSQGNQGCCLNICSGRSKYPDPYNFRVCGLNNLPENKNNFQSNYIKTSKYTPCTFLPYAIKKQYQRMANLYFTFMAILQSWKLISPFPILTVWTPITVVLTISLIREAYEDYQRYRSDCQINKYKTSVRKQRQFVEVQWNKVCVGDICRVKQDQIFPADMLLLTSSNQGGTAFIQTASLDGQKNLKPRNSHKSTIKYLNPQQLNKINGQFKGSIPDKQLHKFSCNLIINQQTIVYQSNKQLLYRGTKLKNTNWIYGLVIYTGKNSKIMMNCQGQISKMSQIQLRVNRFLVFIVIAQAAISVIAAICYRSFQADNSIDYISKVELQSSTVIELILVALRYYLLLNSMIPVSLIVSLQMVKMSQSYFINKDNLMYSQYRKKSAFVKTASLNQQLGQIQYVFSDKTGTLTMNKMEFKIALIGSEMYGDTSVIVQGTNIPKQIQQSKFCDQRLRRLIHQGAGNRQFRNNLKITGGKQIRIKTQAQLCQEFLFALSVAHQVVAQKNQKGQNEYHGPSPDQITLVDAARQMSYQFIKSTQSKIQVKIKSVPREFELLQVFPFTSDRKRMSVIIRVNGVLKMYTKGADSIVKSRLSRQNTLNLDRQLNQFSRFGLRTLLIAMRTVSDEQYSSFRRRVQSLPPTNRQAAHDQLISQLQKNLYIIGATAVLDRLQDFVPQTIRDLLRANIKVWMLTGDKMETAENIARSCNLFQNSFQILKLSTNQYSKNVVACLDKIIQRSKYLIKNQKPKGLLIQGEDLTTIFSQQESRVKLAELAKNCEAVVCCRLMPSQKADIVTLVRSQIKKITLAIGDGGNDVPMIKAAHIGIGLYGQQGMSAVQASDYALPQFRMLWRLLFVHGRWNYIRISEMILYFFYKNMLFTIPQFVLSYYCAFSAQSIYDGGYIMTYNLVFTSIPLVIRAVLEQDINYIVKKKPDSNPKLQIKKLIHQPFEDQTKYLPKGYEINPYLYKLLPKLYFIGQESCIFNFLNFILWVVQAVCEAIMITLLTVNMLGDSSINISGLNNSLWLVGLSTVSSVMCVITFKILSHTKFFSKIFIFGVIFLSITLYLLYMWIDNYFYTTNIEGTVIVAWTSPKAYIVVIFSGIIVLFMDGILVHIDFKKGGYTSKIRKIIGEEKEQRRSAYDRMSIKITEYNNDSPRNTHSMDPIKKK